MKTKRNLAAALLIASCMASMPASAEPQFPVAAGDLQGNYFGLGVGFVPDYSGSDEYMGGIAPVGRYNFANNRYVELLGNYAYANLLNNENWRFGPAFQYRFGRSDVDDDVVKLMSDRDDTLEGGVILSYTKRIGGDIRHRYGFSVDMLHDLQGNHDGYSGTAGARYWRPVSKAVDLGINGSIVYADDNFNDYNYSVNTADAAASGLPAFTAGGGLNAYRIMPMAMVHLSQKWHVGAGVRWEHLTGDAADSPIVKTRGDEDQFAGGVGVVYAW